MTKERLETLLYNALDKFRCDEYEKENVLYYLGMSKEELKEIENKFEKVWFNSKYAIGIENEEEHIDYWEYEEDEFELALAKYESITLQKGETKYLEDLESGVYMLFANFND